MQQGPLRPHPDLVCLPPNGTMGPAAMSDVDAALADATRQVGPAQRYGESGSRGRPTQAWAD